MSTVAIYRGPTKGYSLTDTDVLWLARAFVGEFEGHLTRKNAQWHFWCWMDRFLLINGKWLTTGADFYEFLRSHSQAINPIWMTAGAEKCANSSKGACDPLRITRRHKMCDLTVGQLESYGVYKWALEAQVGTLERPTSQPLYNFAACENIRLYQGDRPDYGINVDGQCFITRDSWMNKYDGALVRNPDGSIPGAVTTGLTVKKLGISALGVIFGAAVLWAIWKLKPWKRLGK